MAWNTISPSNRPATKQKSAMKFFGFKKQRKDDGQRQQHASGPETRTDVDVKRIQTQTKDLGNRELGTISQPANRATAQQQTPKQPEKRPPMPPIRVSPKAKVKQSPQSILHKNTHFGAAPLSPPPPPTFSMSPVPAYDNSPRVRFMAAGSGGSVAGSEASKASNVHMMAGSFASSSAMSSSMVMSDEQKRLNAMGMGCADSKSDTARRTEEHQRLNTMGMSHRSSN